MKNIRWSIITVLLIICATTSLLYAAPDADKGNNGNNGNSENHGGPPPNIPPSESSALNRDLDSHPGLGNAYAYGHSNHSPSHDIYIPPKGLADSTYITPETQTNVCNIGSTEPTLYVSTNNLVDGNYILEDKLDSFDAKGLIQFEASKEIGGDIFETAMNRQGIIESRCIVKKNGVIYLASNPNIKTDSFIAALPAALQSVLLRWSDRVILAFLHLASGWLYLMPTGYIYLGLLSI